MERKCSSCGIIKELNEINYPRKNTGRKGFDSQCKECKREYDKKRYQKNKEKVSQEKAIYYQKNKDKIQKRQLEYYHSNPEKCRESEKNWRKNNPTRRRMSCASSRTKKFDAETSLSENEWLSIKARFNNCCAYCGISESDHLKEYGELLHQEHVIPLVEQGPYCLGNILPSCRSCNSSKANHDFFEWYPKSKGYSRFRERKILQYLQEFDVKELKIWN